MEKSSYNKNLKQTARSLRNVSTLGEVILWNNALKNKKMLGLQFNRQFPIDKYIVDFICRKLKLIIEIDGYSHQFKYDKDIERDEQLKKLGFSVLRFTEQQVRNDLQNVIRGIESFVRDQSPDPLLQGGKKNDIFEEDDIKM
jgi:very-short-patch-repair endonuclease